MSKHLSDIVQCRKLAGIGIGRVCVVHDGRCVGCDSYFNLQTPAHVCDECHFLSTAAQSSAPIPAASASSSSSLLTASGGGDKQSGDASIGTARGRCLVCNSLAVADAFYCRNCTMLEKDRDGCPTVINLAQDRIDTHYKKQKEKKAANAAASRMNAAAGGGLVMEMDADVDAELDQDATYDQY